MGLVGLKARYPKYLEPNFIPAIRIILPCRSDETVLYICTDVTNFFGVIGAEKCFVDRIWSWKKSRGVFDYSWHYELHESAIKKFKSGPLKRLSWNGYFNEIYQFNPLPRIEAN